MEYVTDLKATKNREVLVAGISKKYMYESMKIIKELYRQTDGRQYIHAIISLKESKCDILEKVVFKIMADNFPEYQYVVSTHQNTRHIHCHIVINSVNAENGKKFQMSKKELKAFKENVHEILKEYGIDEDIDLYETDDDSIEIEEDDDPVYIDEISCEEEEETDVIQLVSWVEEEQKNEVIQLVQPYEESNVIQLVQPYEENNIIQLVSPLKSEKRIPLVKPLESGVIQLVSWRIDTDKK
jgi:hypothetical protein